MLSARLREETGRCVKHQNKMVFMPFSHTQQKCTRNIKKKEGRVIAGVAGSLIFFSEETVGRCLGAASPVPLRDAYPTHDLFCLPQGAGCCGDPLPACSQAEHLCQEFALMWLFLPSLPWAGETGKSPQSSEAGYSVPVTQYWKGNPACVTTTATVGLSRPPDLCRFVCILWYVLQESQIQLSRSGRMSQ